MPNESEKRAIIDKVLNEGAPYDPDDLKALVCAPSTEAEMDREGYVFFPRPNGQIPGWFAQCFGMFERENQNNFTDMFCQPHPALDTPCKLLPLDQRQWNRTHKIAFTRPVRVINYT